MIPALVGGNLPIGIHVATWEELGKCCATTQHRKRLMGGLRAAARELARNGCVLLYVDGSFITEKEIPGDYDGCWDMRGVNLRTLDPILLTFSAHRAAQKAKYLGELFPAQLPNGPSGVTFLQFFQIDKVTGDAKGIIALDLKKNRP